MHTSPDTWHSAAFNTNPVLFLSELRINLTLRHSFDLISNRVRVGVRMAKDIPFKQSDDFDL
jgi:hypothetical protein